MICKLCGEEKKHHAHGMCKRCYHVNYRMNHKEDIKEYYLTNRDKLRESGRQNYYKNRGGATIENKQCPSFLGVHVAEQVLSKVFKDVKRMPNGHKGFDFICNKGKKIDVKSACTWARLNHGECWGFSINRNTIADYFLCLAFDNREDLNPLHIWLIPSYIINNRIKTSISKSTLSKWEEYALDINRVISCCNSMKLAKV